MPDSDTQPTEDNLDLETQGTDQDTDSLDSGLDTSGFDDGGDAGADDMGDAGDLDTPAPRSRAQERIQELIAQNKALKELAEKSRQPYIPPAPEPRLEDMAPEERQAYQTLKLRNEVNGAIGYLADQMDQLRFETLKSTNPLVAKLAPRIETAFQQARARGLGISREEASKFVLGEEMLKRKNPVRSSKAAAPAAPRKPVSGRSKGAEGVDTDEGFEERMKNYTF